MERTPDPTWYDVLGVSRDATPQQVKAAWRHATDRFEPGTGSGQFRMFNDAADVLLDPERRRAYDASLAPEPAAEAATTAGAAGTAETPGPAETDAPSGPPLEPAASADAPEGPRRRRGLVSTLGNLPVTVLAVLAVLTVAVLVVTAVVGVKAHQEGNVVDARDQAPAAAERAVKALFSYDYRDLDDERKRAEGFMTPTFATKYLRNFDALQKQKDGTPGLAVQTKAVVNANVQSSGVVDAEDGVARVLVFVDLVSRKAGGDPQNFLNRVAMTMVKDGDRWLVDNVTSY